MFRLDIGPAFKISHYVNLPKSKILRNSKAFLIPNILDKGQSTFIGTLDINHRP